MNMTNLEAFPQSVGGHYLTFCEVESVCTDSTLCCSLLVSCLCNAARRVRPSFCVFISTKGLAIHVVCVDSDAVRRILPSSAYLALSKT